MPAIGELFIGSDHAGFALKSHLIKKFRAYRWQDLGCSDLTPIDYPQIADLVALRVSQNEGFGVLVCGSGQGMAIRANRYPRVRAALCWDEKTAELSRAHNDANLLCLAQRLLHFELCEKILEAFLGTAFEAGRHQARVEKLDAPLITRLELEDS